MNRIQSPQTFRDMRKNVIDVIRFCADDKNRDVSAGKVLLIANAFVHGQEHVEFSFGHRKQVTVLLSAEAGLLHCRAFMAGGSSA